jgi:hypothetical protein
MKTRYSGVSTEYPCTHTGYKMGWEKPVCDLKAASVWDPSRLFRQSHKGCSRKFSCEPLNVGV